jgi:ferredoxin
MRQELPGAAPTVDRAVCIGCGVCSRRCRRRAIMLTVRPERIITPLDSAHRTVVMAIERGKLQNLIFPEQGLASHRALAAVLGVILRLPPLKQVMASEQIKSRYLEGLIARRRYW